MCSPSLVVGGIAAVISGGTQYAAADQRADTQEQVASYNARQQEIEAAQIKRKGISQENRLREKASDKIAQQRAQAAGAGVRATTGGAFQLQEGVRVESNADALQIRENFEQNADAARAGAELTRFKGKASKYNTLLSGAGSAIQSAGSAFSTASGAYNKLNPGGSGFSTPGGKYKGGLNTSRSGSGLV